MGNMVMEKLRSNRKLFMQNGLTYVGIFGSYARGEETKSSDIDLLFDYDKPLSLFEIADLKISLQDSLEKDVDLISRRALKPRFKQYIKRDLQTIYERG